MANKIKSGDLLHIQYQDLGVIGGLPIAIVGSDPAAGWTFQGEQVSININNQSGGWIQISTQQGDANGYYLANNTSITYDLSPDWNGTIWCVATQGAPITNVLIVLTRLSIT